MAVVRALRTAVVGAALALLLAGSATAHAQVVTTPPTEPPPTSPPPTDPPQPEPTTPPVTDPPEPEPTTPPSTSPTTRARTTVTRTRGSTTSSTSSTTPGPTTTLFVIPGEAGPPTTGGATTIVTIPQNDEIPTWATNLFWIGIAGALVITVTTFVMTGRSR